MDVLFALDPHVRDENRGMIFTDYIAATESSKTVVVEKEKPEEALSFVSAFAHCDLINSIQ